jgi:hypothetical protein
MQAPRHPIALIILTLVALMARPAPVGADILLPGTHGVSHQILIEGLEAFPDRTFVLYPTHVGDDAAGVSRILAPGEPVSFYKLVQPRIYAFPGRLASVGPLTKASFEDPTLPRTEIALELISSAPDGDPTRKVHTTYRVTGIEGATVAMTEVGELRFDQQGDPVGPAAISRANVISMIAVAAVGAALLVLIVHRRRQAAAPA